MMVHYHLLDAEFDTDSKNHLLRTLRWHLRRLRQRKFTKCQNDNNEISQVWHQFCHVIIIPRSDLYGTSRTMPPVLSPPRFSEPSEVKTPRTAAPKWSTQFHFFGQNSKSVEKYCNIDQKKGNFLLIPNITGWALCDNTRRNGGRFSEQNRRFGRNGTGRFSGTYGWIIFRHSAGRFTSSVKVLIKFQHPNSKTPDGWGGLNFLHIFFQLLSLLPFFAFACGKC